MSKQVDMRGKKKKVDILDRAEEEFTQENYRELIAELRNTRCALALERAKLADMREFIESVSVITQTLTTDLQDLISDC